MKQDILNNVSKFERTDSNKVAGKYSKLIEALKQYKIVRDNSHAKVTIKFNNGGILYIEVEDKKVFK